MQTRLGTYRPLQKQQEPHGQQQQHRQPQPQDQQPPHQPQDEQPQQQKATAPATAAEDEGPGDSISSSSSISSSRGDSKRCKTDDRSPSTHSVHGVATGGVVLLGRKRRPADVEDDDRRPADDEMDEIQNRQSRQDFAEKFHRREDREWNRIPDAAGGEDDDGWMVLRDGPSPTETIVGSPTRPSNVGSPTVWPCTVQIYSHDKHTWPKLQNVLSIDVREFYDPHAKSSGLRNHDGRHPAIMVGLVTHSNFVATVLAPCKAHMKKHRRGHASIAFWCNRGRHRSVAAAELLYLTLDKIPLGEDHDVEITIEHMSCRRNGLFCKCDKCTNSARKNDESWAALEDMWNSI